VLAETLNTAQSIIVDGAIVCGEHCTFKAWIGKD